MPQQINYGRGSKKRVRIIGWKRRELLEATVLLVCSGFIAIAVAVWFELQRVD
jgi:hypothetical protein